MNLLLTIFIALLSFVYCQGSSFNLISLDTMLPEQLQGLLKQDWKSTLVG
jgi:hypothetical protein